jgi:hypothetical protein
MRKGGRTDMVEATCKRLEEQSGTYILHPESTNPNHAPMLLAKLSDDQDIWIHTVVVAATVRFG